MTGSFLVNSEISPGIFRLHQSILGPPAAFLVFDFRPFNSSTQIQDCIEGCSILLFAQGSVQGQSPSVPEPSALLLLAIGLLALAGSRWLPRRGVRQQLG